MALTRTHNLDVANDDLHVETLYSSFNDGFETVEMGIADPSVIFSMLSDLSSDRGQYALREIFSNAYDATIRANPDNPQPIEINLDASVEQNSLVTKLLGITETVASLTVIDHGCGMTPDEVRQNFLQYGGSDKREDVNAIGSKGLGSKAPLAVCDSFHVRTVKDGVATSVIVSRNPKKMNTATVAVTTTTDTNGTQVTVPIADEMTLSQMNKTLDTIRTFCCDVPLIINGNKITKALPTTIGESGAGYIYVGTLTIPTDDEPLVMRVWEPDPDTKDSKKNRNDTSSEIALRNAYFPLTGITEGCMDLLIGGYTYTLDTQYGWKNPLVAIDPGWLDFTPSRDEIKKNKTYNDFIRTVARHWSNLDHARALEHWFAQHDDMALVRLISDYTLETPSSRHMYSYNKSTRKFNDNNTLTLLGSHGSHINIALNEIETAHPGIIDTLSMEGDDFQTKFPMIITFSREINNNRAITFVNNRNLKQKELKDVLSMHESRITANAGEWITNLAKSLTRYQPHAFSHLYIINEIPEELPMSAVAKALPDFFDDLERCGDKKGTSIVVVPETEHAKVPDHIKLFLADRITCLTMDDLIKRGRDMRREKNRARRKLQEARMSGGPVPRRKASDDSWKLDEVATLKIPDNSYDIDQLIAYATGRDHALDKDSDASPYSYSYYRTSRIYSHSAGLRSIATNSTDTPLESCAIILGSGRHQTCQTAYRWASLIALSRKAGNPIVPNTVTHVVLTGDKQTTQRQAENYVILGATILQDYRENVKRREDTLINTCPYLTSLESGLNIGITRPDMIIGDDAVIKTFLILQESAKLRDKTNYQNDVLPSTYILMRCLETSTDTTIQDTVVQPMHKFFVNPETTREFAPWTVKTNKLPVNVTETGIRIIPEKSLSEDIKKNMRALRIAYKTMTPINNIFSLKNSSRENTISDENLIALRGMIGSSLETNTLLTIDNTPISNNEEGNES